MIEARPEQQVVDVPVVGFHGRLAADEPDDYHPERVEERYDEHGNRDRGR